MSETPKGGILINRRDDGAPALEVRLESDTLWLSQQQIAELFQSSRINCVEHLKHIYEEGELNLGATCRKFRQVRMEGSREVSRAISFYNLDAIISVGYRIKSRLATQFRIWATERLREYLIKGFTMDDSRLKELGGGVYWRDLLDRIRDIRRSEKVLYRQVLDLYATSVDYDLKAEETVLFFKSVQNKLHYAAHGRTAAEVIEARADASKPNMGLTYFLGEVPRKSDISIANNYFDEPEIKKLNTLVSEFFDAAVFRSQNRDPSNVRDWLQQLDRLTTALDLSVLKTSGTVSQEQAVKVAEQEYERFRQLAAGLPPNVETHLRETLKQAQRKIDGEIDMRVIDDFLAKIGQIIAQQLTRRVAAIAIVGKVRGVAV